MTSRVYINIEADSAVEARDQMAVLLRGHPAVEASAQPLDFKDSVREPLVLDEAGFRGQPPVDNAIVAEGATAFTDAEITANAKPTRERGKPSPGHKRRTNAEIAEDEAADKASIDAHNAAELAGADEVAAISTGEERVGPEDDEAAQAADAADEAAETAAAKTGLTLDDLRNASTPYVKKFGLAAASEDTRKLLGFPLAECPADKLEWAIKTLTDAVVSNPLKRTAVGEATTEPAPAATKDDVKRALAAYALKYDGQNTDAKNMPATLEDGPRVLKLRFGDDVDSVGKIPASPENYAQAVRDIEEMIEKNPWKREVKNG